MEKETQGELEKPIGTTEPKNKSLPPKKVKIVKCEIIEVGEKKNKKVNCSVLHPDHKDGTITISSVAYLRDKKVICTGLWYNLDKEDLIQMGSALAVFMEATGAKTIKELEGKEVDTELEKNFLCFKAY